MSLLLQRKGKARKRQKRKKREKAEGYRVPFLITYAANLL